jgi:hypothetical protein
MVHVKVTWPPLRTAARSAAFSGKLSEGGRGAPGMPHPASSAAANAATAIFAARAAGSHLSALLIAISV